MKRNWKRELVTVVMALAIMVTALPQQVTAKTVDVSKITFPTSRTMWSCDEGIGADDDLMLEGEHLPDGAIIVNIKSSDPKVVKIDKYTWDEDTGECEDTILLKKKGAGTATISYDVIWGKQKRYWQHNKQLVSAGEMKHFETKITLIKYQNPCKYFKLGNKDVKKKLNKTPKKWKYVKAGKYKLSIKARKGWKLTKITCGGKKIKNKSKITVKKKKKDAYGNPIQTEVIINAYFKDKKTNRKRPIEMTFYSKN